MSVRDFTEFSSYILSVGRELIPGYDPDNTEDLDYLTRCAVFETAFERRPELFEKLSWINDDDGMPLWVRPGVEWSPDYELADETDDED